MRNTQQNDYAWLDDLTINQLKAPDAEIHKRLPAEPANDASNNETDSNPLLGLLLGNNSAEEEVVEPQTLAVGEKKSLNQPSLKSWA